MHNMEIPYVLFQYVFIFYIKTKIKLKRKV